MITRRRFMKTAFFGGGGLALYAGEIERHWIDVTHREFRIAGLPGAFDGMRIAQLSDIHLEEFTEPFLLRAAIDEIDRLQPDMVLLTGDYISHEVLPRKQTLEAAWQCALMLGRLKCRRRYAVLGNHDVSTGSHEVIEALTSHGVPVLHNAFVPLEQGGDRMWLAGLDDPVCGHPDPERAIPERIRDLKNEPVVLMCHAPDFADTLIATPAGRAVALMLSGHTHGGQIRLPLIGPLHLPTGGKRYDQGLFRLGPMQLYVNRGIGSVGVPFRFDCRPEVTSFTLRAT